MTIDYDALERMHKQEGWTNDQQYHFEAGWEAGQWEMRRRLTGIVEDLHVDTVPERPVSAAAVTRRPSDVEHAMAYLREALGPAGRTEVLSRTAAQLHHTLGQSIRNNFGLWTDNTKLRIDAARFYIGPVVYDSDPDSVAKGGVTHLDDGLLHPDVVSDIIVKQLQGELSK